MEKVAAGQASPKSRVLVAGGYVPKRLAALIAAREERARRREVRHAR
jgi:hypothetical protein